MNELMERRRALMGEKIGKDTTAEIEQYGVYWDSTKTTKPNANYCVTKRYYPSNSSPRLSLYVGPLSGITRYVLYKANANTPFNYWNAANPQWSGGAVSASFTILQNDLENAYVYDKSSGEVLFAGKNTPYYGKTNVDE